MIKHPCDLFKLPLIILMIFVILIKRNVNYLFVHFATLNCLLLVLILLLMNLALITKQVRHILLKLMRHLWALSLNLTPIILIPHLQRRLTWELIKLRLWIFRNRILHKFNSYSLKQLPLQRIELIRSSIYNWLLALNRNSNRLRLLLILFFAFAIFRLLPQDVFNLRHNIHHFFNFLQLNLLLLFL